MATVIYGKETKQRCFPEAPDLGGCGPDCAPKCEPCCAVGKHKPKTRARDAIKMIPRETERTFSFYAFACRGDQIPMNYTKVSLVLRRRGSCAEIGCITPLRATLDAGAVFQWPDKFLEAAPGQYEADLYLNDCEVGSVLLVKPDARARIVTSDPVAEDYANDECHECPQCGGGTRPGCDPCSCDAPCCGDFIEPDIEPEMPQYDCGGCEVC